MKFKKGDKVKIVKVAGKYGDRYEDCIGKVVVIEKTGSGDFEIKLRGIRNWWDESELKLVKQGLRDMQVGDVIVNKHGSCSSKVIFTNKDGFLHRSRSGHYMWDSYKYVEKAGWKIKGQKCETCGK